MPQVSSEIQQYLSVMHRRQEGMSGIEDVNCFNKFNIEELMPVGQHRCGRLLSESLNVVQ